MPMKNYSFLVRFGKFFLWVLAAGIIAIVVLIGRGESPDSGGRIVFNNTSTLPPKSEDLQSVMKKPNYHGIDAHNRPYTISADTGVQQDKETVVLENIAAEMTGDNNAWIALNAGHGVMNTTTKQLELTDGVEVFYDSGYQFRTDHAHVDINHGSATGDSKIEGQGEAGTLQAKSFSISERGDVINFKGAVKVVLYQ